jgi:small conductance mechanosensitive channel
MMNLLERFMLLVLLGVFPTDQLSETISEMINTIISRLPFLAIGLIAFILFLILARIAKLIIVQIGERTRIDVTLAKILGSLASIVTVILGILVVAVIIFPTFSPGNLVAGLGITSVAIGFAFKDILQNIFAGLLILWRKPFLIGDQIRSQNFEGTVEEINIRSTHVKTYDGERVVIPNADIFTRPIVVNTAYDKRRIRFTVGIGYLDSIEKARSTIHQVLSNTAGVLKSPEPWVYVSELAPSSVNFNVYFWAEPEQAIVLKVSDKVATSIKLALDKEGIDIPYPHTVILFHDVTGSRLGDIDRSVYLKHKDIG